MGTEILRPHDCLIPSAAVVFPRRRSSGHANFRGSKVNRRSIPVRNQQGRQFVSGREQPSVPRRYGDSDDLGLAMENGIIRRRSDSHHTHVQGLKKEGAELIAGGTGRLRSDSEMVPRQTRTVDLRLGFSSKKVADVYAGSAFSTSPAPSSLPFPSFSTKKQMSVAVDDSATRDLRRLLRLE